MRGYLVPVVTADYIPAKFKRPLFVRVKVFQIESTKEFDEEGNPKRGTLFEGEALIHSPIMVEQTSFNLAVVDVVGHTFKRYLKLRQEFDRLAPNLQDEYTELNAIFEY